MLAIGNHTPYSHTTGRANTSFRIVLQVLLPMTGQVVLSNGGRREE